MLRFFRSVDPFLWMLNALFFRLRWLITNLIAVKWLL